MAARLAEAGLRTGRPGRHRLRQWARVDAGLSRMRLGGDHRGPDQHRFARRATRTYPEQLRRAARGRRRGICRAVVATRGCGAPLDRLWIVGAAGPRDSLGLCCREPLPAPGEPIPAHPSRPGETVAILYTSGTTGPSKGVCCPQAQYFWWAAHTAALLGLREGEVLLTTLPLFHTNALNAFYQALLTGSTLIVERRFSVSDFLAGLVRHRGDSDLPAGGDGAYAAFARRPPTRNAVMTCASLWRPACPLNITKRSPAASASRS